MAWVLVFVFTVDVAFSQVAPPGVGGLRPGAGVDEANAAAEAAAEEAFGDERQVKLEFLSAPLDIVLEEYSEHTGRTLLMGPKIPQASVTLRSRGSLPIEDYMNAIETVLGMHGVALHDEGDFFTRVVARSEARKVAPMRIGKPMDKGEQFQDIGKLVSQMIRLKSIEVSEAEGAIEKLTSAFSTFTPFEAINSFLLTDSAENVNRVMDLLEYIDVPIQALEKPFIVQIKYAIAADIKAKLEEIITEAQKEEKKSTVQRQRSSGPPGVQAGAAIRTRRNPPGVIRAPRSAAKVEIEIERGLIRGDVRIIEDERTNLLIIITRPENMPFFDDIIKVLDVATAPDVMVRVFRLDYAEAQTVAGMLNDLIGAASSGSTTPSRESEDAGRRGSSLDRYVQQQKDRAQQQPQQQGRDRRGVSQATKSKIGRLSQDNIKILSDERTNALIIMASKSDLTALEEIIGDMDTMLSQVAIETIILEINLDDDIRTGMDWVQRALLTYEETEGGDLTPKVAFAGRGGGDNAPIDPLTLTTPGAFGDARAGITYFLTLFDLNVDAVLEAVASDSRTRILSSPIVMTTDNTEASINVTQDQYFFTGQRPIQSGGSLEFVEDVQREKIGIKLTVKPRINEQKDVVMEISQSIENVAGTQRINDNEWPIVASREVEAEIAVRSGDTIVLGGLVRAQDTKSSSKIPILGDIPFAGRFFRNDRRGEEQQEVIVLVTPYVLNTPSEIMRDANRRLEHMEIEGMWERGWSDSRLAEPKLLEDILPEESDELADFEMAVDFEEASFVRPDESMDTMMPDDSLDAMMPAELEVERPVIVASQGEDEEILDISPEIPALEDSPLESVEQPEGPFETEGPMPLGPPEAPVENLEGEWNPMDAIDPELQKYIQNEDKRWKKTLKKVDRKIHREYQPNE